MYYYFIANYQKVYEREDVVNTMIFPQYTPLTQDQVEYHLAHPEALRYEIEHKDDPVPVPTLDEVKVQKIKEINAYDQSSAVNEFFLGETSMWLDKETRTGLKLRFEAEQASGQTSTTLWYKGTPYTLPVQDAIQMLLSIELYASSCYDKTQEHIMNVHDATSIEDVNNYNYKTGYPEKLHFQYE